MNEDGCAGMATSRTGERRRHPSPSTQAPCPPGFYTTPRVSPPRHAPRPTLQRPWGGGRLVGDDVPIQHLARHHTHRQSAHLSLIHISEPTRLGMISYAVFCLK